LFFILVHVIFKTSKDANDALPHLDGHVFHGSAMSAKLLNPLSKDKKGRLIVRNIPWQVCIQKNFFFFLKKKKFIISFYLTFVNINNSIVNKNF